MKRMVIGILAVVLVLSMGGAALAEDTSVTLSIKGWLNSWERTGSTGNSVTSDASILMLGPALNVKFGNGIFLGATYLASMSDYEFTSGVNLEKVSRKDTDLVLGYMFNPRFGIFVGYKTIKASVSYEDTSTGFTVDDYGTVQMTGPGIGLLGNIPLGETVALYGNFSYMKLKYKEDFGIYGGTFEENEPGFSFEIGLAAAFSKTVSANIGYKLQSFTGADTDVTEKFSGLTFGLNFTF